MLLRLSLTLTTLLALGVAAEVARGDTVELRSGGTIVGTVRLSGSDDVVVDSVFPEAKMLTLKRDDISPASMHAILDRFADPADGAKRREAGEFAEAHGLLLSAIVDFTMVKKLDPAAAKDMDARIARLNEGVAAEILDDAKALLDSDNPNAALMYLHTLREKYPGTDAAKKAEAVAAAAHKAAGVSADVAAKTVSVEEAPRVAETVEAHLAKGDAEREKGNAHIGSSVGSDQRPAERAVAHYEAAWKAVKTLPVAASGETAFDARVARLRSSTKTKLVDAYLTAGTILLERRAIAGAEKYCNSACELDPENKGSHQLHGLILQAKTLGYRAQRGSSR